MCTFASFFFLSKKYYVVAFGGLLLLGLNLDLLKEQKIFYIEPGMLAALCVLLFAYCFVLYRGRLPSVGAGLFGFLVAFLVATKFSTILFALLPVVLLVSLPDRTKVLKFIGIYVASLPVFYVLINLPAFVSLHSFNLFLHDLFSNFWQYAAGSDPGITVAPGITQMGLLTYQLEGVFGYALYILPAVVVFGLWYATQKERMILWPLTILVLLSLGSLIGQHVYLLRNAIPFYVPLIIISLLSLEIVIRELLPRFGKKYFWGCLVAFILLWGIGIVQHAGGVAPFMLEILPSTKTALQSELQTLYVQSKPEDVWLAVGFPKHFFDGMLSERIITPKQGVPAVLSSKNYPALESEYSELPVGSVVVVAAGGNNKHLTNYILPKFFNKNVQFGGYYVFSDKK